MAMCGRILLAVCVAACDELRQTALAHGGGGGGGHGGGGGFGGGTVAALGGGHMGGGHMGGGWAAATWGAVGYGGYYGGHHGWCITGSATAWALAMAASIPASTAWEVWALASATAATAMADWAMAATDGWAVMEATEGTAATAWATAMHPGHYYGSGYYDPGYIYGSNYTVGYGGLTTPGSTYSYSSAYGSAPVQSGSAAAGTTLSAAKSRALMKRPCLTPQGSPSE